MLPSGKIFRKNIAISPDFVYTGRCMDHSSLRRKQVSSPPVQPHPAASRRGRQNCLPRLFFCCFSILPVFVFSALSLLRIFALTALLSFRCLRFRHCCRTEFCTSPASLIGPIFPRFRLCHRHGSRLFPALLSSRLLLLFGADHMPVFSLFRNQKQSGAWKFFLCRCSVFGFQRGLFLSLWVFALSLFRSASAGFVQLLPHFLTLDRPGFCPAFVQHWTPFCPAAGGASLIEPLWEASYPPVSIRRGPLVFYPSPKSTR